MDDELGDKRSNEHDFSVHRDGAVMLAASLCLRLHLHSVAVPLAGHLLLSHMLLDKNYLILVSGWSSCRFLRLTLFPFPLFSHHLAFPSFPEILKIIDFTDGSRASDRLINKFTSEKPIFHSV